MYGDEGDGEDVYEDQDDGADRIEKDDEVEGCLPPFVLSAVVPTPRSLQRRDGHLEKARLALTLLVSPLPPPQPLSSSLSSLSASSQSYEIGHGDDVKADDERADDR